MALDTRVLLKTNLAEEVNRIASLCNNCDNIVCCKFKITVRYDDIRIISGDRADKDIITAECRVEPGKL